MNNRYIPRHGGEPMLIDGSSARLIITLPSREHPTYLDAVGLLRDSGFCLDPMSRTWQLEGDAAVSSFLDANRVLLRDGLKAHFAPQFQANEIQLSGGLRPSAAAASAMETAHLVPITRLFFLRVGVASSSSSGDFVDNQSPLLAFAVAVCESEQYPLIIYNQSVGLKKFGSDVFLDAINSLQSGIEQTALDANVLAGLLKSTFEQDPDGLMDVDDSYESAFFHATENEEVSAYSPCFFGIGSVSNDVENAYLDCASDQIFHDGKQLKCLADLFGRLDEDDSWVVGVRLK